MEFENGQTDDLFKNYESNNVISFILFYLIKSLANSLNSIIMKNLMKPFGIILMAFATCLFSCQDDFNLDHQLDKKTYQTVMDSLRETHSMLNLKFDEAMYTDPNYFDARIGSSNFDYTYWLFWNGNSTSNVYYGRSNSFTSWSPTTQYTLPGSTNGGVDAIFFRGKIRAFFKSSSSYTLWQNSSSNGSSWSSSFISNMTTSTTPGVAIFKNKLYIMAKDDTSNDIYYATSDDGENFTNAISHSGSTAEAVSLIVFKDKLYEFHKHNSYTIGYSYTSDGSNW